LQKEITYALNYALNKGFQIHPDAFKILEEIDVKQLEKIIKDIVREKSKKRLFLISQNDLESYLGIREDETLKSEVSVVYDPTPYLTSAAGVEGFNSLFASRFSKLKRIISDRPEAKKIKTISSVISTKKLEDDVYVCGLVTSRSSERNISKVSLDDPSGSIELIVFDRDLQEVADSLMLDQFIMARISPGKNGGYVAKDIIFPDIPDHSTTRSQTETFAVFLSDLHGGSRYFMEEELAEFIRWLSSPDPIARKVRFIILGGDILDGVGIYPNQDKELVQKTIAEQLKKFEEIASKIPKNIKVIIAPGNHDPGRRALPQPAIPEKHNTTIRNNENYLFVGNPAVVSLNGVKVLIFHGQSIDDIVKTTPGLSYSKPANVMRHLLKARHLSPMYGGQTPIAPELEDMMVIDDVPDIFHAGHVHVVDLDLYKNILLINSGTWQQQTPFQTSVGVSPTPGIAVIVNLKTFKVYTKDFRSPDA